MKNKIMANLIDRCRSGDPEAFTLLLHEFGPRLHSYFLRSCGSADQADDLLQDLFLKLLVKIRTFRPTGSFESWLFTIAANLMRDRFRSQKSGPQTVPLQPVGSDDDESWLAEPPSTQPTPPQQLAQSEQLDRLQQALSELAPQDREIILLRHYGDLSFYELAEHFDIPKNTALARVHRGLKKLKKLMETDKKS